MNGDDDEALGALDHDRLVALLDRLYASVGEPSLPRSTARASTDRELRDAIRTVRRRIAARTDPAETRPTPMAPPRHRATRSGERIRIFCVLFTADADLITQARALLRSHGVPVVAVASSVDLAVLAANAMPTHLVIDVRRGADLDLARDLGFRAREVTVLYCPDDAAMLAAVAAIPVAAGRLESDADAT